MELYGHAKQDLLQSFLKLENGIPSHNTFSRVLRMLAPEAFRQWFLGFMEQFAEGIVGGVVLDGRPRAVLTTGPKGNRRCAWSVPGPKSNGWCWGK